MTAVLFWPTACVQADDGFRAKLAAGCNSAESCNTLCEAAEARWQSCMNSSRTTWECNDKMQDKFTASQMRDRLQDADDADKKAQRDATMAEQQRQRDLVQKSIDDRQAENARQACLAPLLSTVKRHRSSPKGLAEVADLSLVRRQADQEIEQARVTLENVRACDPAVADRLAADLDAWATQIAKALADEEGCRQTPSCVAPRLVQPLCDAFADRRQAREELTTERRNPAGVVDLTLLHDLGRRIQDADATIAELTAKYAKLTGKQFGASACPKMP